MSELKVNVNDFVRVKLNNKGQAVIEGKRKEWRARYGNDSTTPWPIEEDGDGYSKWQLWVLMMEFGPHTSHAGTCFASDILVDSANLKTTNETERVLTDDEEYEEFTPDASDIWQAEWQARGIGNWRTWPSDVGKRFDDAFPEPLSDTWMFRRPKPQPVPAAEAVEWSEPFRLSVGDKKPAVCQARYFDDEEWWDCTHPETPVDEHMATYVEFRVPKSAPTATPPTEMTRAIWGQMSLSERREWSRPAYDAIGDGPIQVQISDGSWQDSFGVFSLEYAYRLKPVEPQREPFRAWAKFPRNGEVWQLMERCGIEGKHV